MTRHAQGNGVAAGRDFVGDTPLFLHDQRQRSGPEFVGELSWEIFRQRLRHRDVTNVNDERIPVGAIFCGENFADRLRVECVSPKAVDGFRWEPYESAASENRGSARDGVGLVGREDNRFHDWQDKRLCYDGRAKMKNTAILLVDCPDRKGIVAAISDFLYRYNANILHADQHQDAEMGLFLTRVEWDLGDFKLEISDFRKEFAPIAEKFQMRWRVELSAKRPRMAILVSKLLHCLADLLYRHESGELACEIPLILSNHKEAQRLAEFHRIPF